MTPRTTTKSRKKAAATVDGEELQGSTEAAAALSSSQGTPGAAAVTTTSPAEKKDRTAAASAKSQKPASSKPRESSSDDKKASNDEDDDDTCLHCHTLALSDVQVRCDECNAYICNSCHWCHEFQANHEIRVCDRCDAFYCRGCDEMDQCDDCGEVVCASCSTLLSCKFCGGGLCEECATACGRCGIVLCSRDAKFAVECDTCRLSYCLVCLASGNKDPCVRCGHRPSKRMEQLVHLRLKSIYKAFKQTSTQSVATMSCGSPAVTSNRPTNGSARSRENNDDPDARNHKSTVADDTEALLVAAASAAQSASSGASSTNHSDKKPGADNLRERATAAASDAIAKYAEEKQKADEAAAALLAELEEEEQLEQSKKNKKKKKKERQQAKREEEKKKEDLSTTKSDLNAEEEEAVSAEKVSFFSVTNAGTSTRSKETVDDDAVVEHTRSTKGDPVEEQFDSLVVAEDVDGLEELLFSIKGVPGRATTRKNIKKAIKRLRTPFSELEHAISESPAPASNEEDRIGAATPVAQEEGSSRLPELLQIVSLTHNKPPTGVSRAKGTSTTQPTPKSECVMQMAPMIVGWVIGKGGQRIRDLMEESGARIWIDQDSMKPQEPRIVYVSGHRKNVEVAVQMIKDLIIKAPTETPQSKQGTPLLDTTGSRPVEANIKGPGLPDDMLVSNGFQLKPREIHSKLDSKTKHELTCDPRFVPLLIGRRGWTIKNIQDSSGARVDIDQTVTPRKITISGSESGVSKAVRMVQDVLSYPHSQLHGASPSLDDDDDDVQETQETLKDGQDEIAPLPPKETYAHPNGNHAEPVRARSNSSPPSSLIMPGDAKDTISASSSLSSTPEPSMASSSKGNISLVPAGPMLPPPRNDAALQPAEASFNGIAHSNAHSSTLPYRTAAGISPPVDPSSHLGPSVLHGAAHIGGSALLGGHLASPTGHSVSLSQRRSAFDTGNFTALPGNPLPTHRQSAFESAPPLFASSASPDSQLPVANQPLAHAPGSSRGPSAGDAMWNQATSMAPHPGSLHHSGSEEFGLAAAVQFLEHSKQQPRATSVSHVSSDIMGLPSPSQQSSTLQGMHHERGVSAPTSMLHTGRDESRMVDSLFGPSDLGGSDAGLVSGLQGLSLYNNNDSTGTGLWDASVVPGNDVKGLNVLGALNGGAFSESKQHPSLFASSVGNGAEASTPQSRFGWGAN